MALQLLGSKYCIESLRTDVTDLQESVIDVISRAGPVRLPSWKYPDKTGCDLDMTELLEIYDYSEDEEDRQIAHIVLLELVIDRMVLLIQCVSKFLDQMTVTGQTAQSPQLSRSNNTSIGLVVKKFWNKMVHCQSVVQNISRENKNNKTKVADLENNMKKVMQEREYLQNVTENLQETLQTAKTPFPLSDADLEKAVSRAPSTISISRDECNKSTQTLETAFVPCESCDCVQKLFRHSGDVIIDMCQSQGLPSGLGKYKPQVKGLDWMTGNDVMRWSSEQEKDLARLKNHLSNFDTLKVDFEALSQKNTKLTKKLADSDKEIKLERETQNTQRRHYEGKIKDIQKTNQMEVNDVKKLNENLCQGKQQLEKQLTQMHGELEKQQGLLQDLEFAKQQLQEDLQQSKTNNAQVKALEKDIGKYEKQLKDVNQQLEGAQKQLAKEKVKNKSITKHNESVQGKQDSLLQRLDEIDQENEELKNDISTLEEAKETLEETIDKINEQKEEIEGKLKEQQELVKDISREKKKLENCIGEMKDEISQLENTIQGAKEHEKLLVEYPDLNGPVNPDFTGTGDIAKDMENQVKANSIRIQILEEQNAKLRKSITKILEAQQKHENTFQMNNPMPLWKVPDHSHSPEPTMEPYEGSTYTYNKPTATKQRHPEPGLKALERMAENTAVRESFVIGRGAKTPDKKPSKKQNSRPPSAKAGSSSIGAYVGLKKAGLLNKDLGRPPSGQSERSNYQKPDILTCPKCDKMYDTKKDLEIHKSYCQG